MADASQLPRWQSHKVVSAGKIVSVNRSQKSGDQIVIPLTVEGHSGQILVECAANMFARYTPIPGDYYVVYDDGYASISPRQAFEEGYHRL